MGLLRSTGVLIVVAGSLMGVSVLAMESESPARQSEVGKEFHTTSPTTSSSRYVNVEGTLKEIQGDMYVLEGASGEQAIQIHVGKDTAFPNGKKEPGQPVQALVSGEDGHALIIR